MSDILEYPQNKELLENWQGSIPYIEGIKDLVRSIAIIICTPNPNLTIKKRITRLTMIGIVQIWEIDNTFGDIFKKICPLNEEFPENLEEVLKINIALLTSLGLDLSLISKAEEN